MLHHLKFDSIACRVCTLGMAPTNVVVVVCRRRSYYYYYMICTNVSPLQVLFNTSSCSYALDHAVENRRRFGLRFQQKQANCEVSKPQPLYSSCAFQQQRRR